METRRSVPVAVLLSLAMPGLGHVYCGRVKTGGIFWLASFLGWGGFFLGFGLGLLALRAAIACLIALCIVVWIAASVHAGFSAFKVRDRFQPRIYHVWYFYLLLWIVLFALPQWAMFRTTKLKVIGTVYLSADSMRPSLLPGDWVRIDKRAVTLDKLARGDVVAFVDPLDGQTIRILRLVGLGRDQIQISPEGLSVNGTLVPRRGLFEESYPQKTPEGIRKDLAVVRMEEKLGEWKYQIYQSKDDPNSLSGQWALQPDQVLLLGDNRSLYSDPQRIKPIPRTALLGRVFQVRWSRDPLTKKGRRDRRKLPIQP